MASVRFIRTTKEKHINRATYDQNALYFCEDTGELFKGNRVYTDGMRVLQTFEDLPDFNQAADGITYYIIETRNGYVLNPTRNGWVQTIYAPVNSISFAGVAMTEDEGIFSIDQESARQALGISVPEGLEGQEVTIATEETVKTMSEELKVYVDSQITTGGTGTMDYGEV